MRFLKKKGTILLFLSSFYLGNVVAQTCSWAKTPNPNSNCSSVATDALGNVYITGTFGGTAVPFGSSTLSCYGSQNVFLAKYDSNGNALWAQSLAGNGRDWAYGVSTDKFGNIFITGSFNSYNLIAGSFTVYSNGGSYDYYLAKFDSNGNPLWLKSAGGASLENCYTVSNDSNGDAYIVGYSESPTVTIGAYNLSNPPYTMIFAKYDGANGDIIWAKTASGVVLPYGITIDKSDKIYVTGEYSSQTVSLGSNTLASTDGNPDFFVARYDASGDCVWARSGSNRYGYGICNNSAGDIFVFGNFYTPTITVGTYTLNNFSNSGDNQFLVRYDSSGNVIWVKNFGSTTESLGYAVAADETNLYVIGNTWYAGSPTMVGSFSLTTPQNASNPMFFARFDFSGNAIFAKVYNTGGGLTNDQSWLCTDNNKNVYLAGGFSQSPMIIDSYSLTSPTCCGSYIAKFHFDDVGIKENSRNNNGSILYPNPNSGEFMIKIAEDRGSEKVEITIFDITGRLVVKEQRTAGGSGELHVKNDLQNGVYLVKVKFDDGTYDIHHLIIEK